MNSDFCKDPLQRLFIHEELTPEFCRITKEEYAEIIRTKELVSIGFTKTSKDFPSEIDDAALEILNKNLYKYFYYFQRRFLRHYINENLKYAENEKFEPLCSGGLNSIQCALYGKGFEPDKLGTNIEPCIVGAFATKTYNAGGTVFNILLFVFYIIHRRFPELFLTLKEVDKSKFVEFYNSYIKPKVMTDYSVNMYIQTPTTAHSVGFYTCNGKERFFNNNLKQIYDFPYKLLYNTYYDNIQLGYNASIVYIENIGIQEYIKSEEFLELIAQIQIETNKEIFQILLTYDEIHAPLLRLEREIQTDYYDLIKNEWYTIIKNGADEILIEEFFDRQKIFFVEFQSYFFHNLTTLQEPQVEIIIPESQYARKKRLAAAAAAAGKRGGTRKAKRRSKKYAKTRKHKK
jgi:hypothetical protein